VQYTWNWSVLFQQPYLDWLLSGLLWTVMVSATAWIIALALGTVIGIARTLPSRVARGVGSAYVELFRNVPVLVQLFLWYHVMPELLPNRWGMWVKRDMPLPEFWTAVICLGFYMGARVAEQVRSGIEAVPKGQRSAALASGLTPRQAYQYVVLPICFRIIVPPLTSEMLSITRTSSIALTIGVLELTVQSRRIENQTFQGLEAFAAATVLYIAVALGITLIMRLIERRAAIPGLMAKGMLTG
jgi:glutamate/aspartate transport system permease protein